MILSRGKREKLERVFWEGAIAREMFQVAKIKRGETRKVDGFLSLFSGKLRSANDIIRGRT